MKEVKSLDQFCKLLKDRDPEAMALIREIVGSSIISSSSFLNFSPNATENSFILDKESLEEMFHIYSFHDGFEHGILAGLYTAKTEGYPDVVDFEEIIIDTIIKEGINQELLADKKGIIKAAADWYFNNDRIGTDVILKTYSIEPMLAKEVCDTINSVIEPLNQSDFKDVLNIIVEEMLKGEFDNIIDLIEEKYEEEPFVPFIKITPFEKNGQTFVMFDYSTVSGLNSISMLLVEVNGQIQCVKAGYSGCSDHADFESQIVKVCSKNEKFTREYGAGEKAVNDALKIICYANRGIEHVEKNITECLFNVYDNEAIIDMLYHRPDLAKKTLSVCKSVLKANENLKYLGMDCYDDGLLKAINSLKEVKNVCKQLIANPKLATPISEEDYQKAATDFVMGLIEYKKEEKENTERFLHGELKIEDIV